MKNKLYDKLYNTDYIPIPYSVVKSEKTNED